MQPSGKVYWMKPGLEVSGMAGATYDMEGRLLRFYSVPPQLEPELASPAAAPDWSHALLRGPARPGLVPRRGRRAGRPLSSSTRAPRGRDPGRAGPTSSVRIEAAAHRGRPAWFEIVWPWTRPERMETQSWPTAKLLYRALFLTRGRGPRSARRLSWRAATWCWGAATGAAPSAWRSCCAAWASCRGRSAPTTWRTGMRRSAW